MSRRRNLPLTEAQQRRWSPAPVGTLVVAHRRLGGVNAMSWAIASAVGSIIAPDGSLRDLYAGELKYVRGVLLTFEHREQLRRMELVDDPENGGRRPLPLRTYQRRVHSWIDAGLAHRCTRDAEITLYLETRHLPGDPCPWASCPASATGLRPERNGMTPRAQRDDAEGREADSLPSVLTPELVVPPLLERSGAALGTGVQRGENGDTDALTLIEEHLGPVVRL